MSFSAATPHKPRPPPGQQGSTPFRSTSANKFRSSLVPMNRPSSFRARNPPSKVTGTLATERDIFNTSTPRTTRTTPFAPSLPAESTRAGPGVRKFAPQRSAHGGMSSTASTELFKMRIPSPDPDLTGEALAKEVPDDPNRKGSVYADQFLAHRCPPHFDDLQRRQFFCILDLRRLKYAADEIFARKDWKLNILNFAKEYEKSRGLIMLRYGLYEFKNVKPSEEVLKKWRAAHGLPDPEPQESTVPTSSGQPSRRAGPFSAGSTKRKAEDELAPKDNTLMASNTNQNKRRNMEPELADPVFAGPAPFKKSKRKADETDEPDENQPSKMQKPAPSPATSKFESILNKAQSGNSSPLKRSATPLASLGAQKSNGPQSTSFTTKSNPFAKSSNGIDLGLAKTANGGSASGSVLSSHKIGSTPATNSGNIFSYLSESSANNSGNENGNADDDDDDTDSESGPEEEENQEAAPSEEPSTAASVGTSTPPTQIGSALFSGNKTSNTSNIFGSLTKPSDLASKGGLFGRVKMGANGQPLRATSDLEVKEDDSTAEQLTTKAEQIKTPAKPGDYTFNPTTTPISFGQSSSNTPKPSAIMSSTEPTKEPSKAESSSMTRSSSIFASDKQATQAPQPNVHTSFASPDLSKPKATEGASSSFGEPKSTPTAASLFNATPVKPLFGNLSKANEPGTSDSKEEKTNIFGKPVKEIETTSLFSNAKKVEAVPTSPSKEKPQNIFSASSGGVNSTPQVKPLFGGSIQKANGIGTNGASSPGLFGNSTKSPAPSLFGANSNSPLFGVKANAAPSESTKSGFGTADKPPSSSFIFGGSKPETTSATDKTSNVPDQGESRTPETPAVTPLFGTGASKPAPTTPTPLFGNSQSASTETKPKESTTAKTGLFSNNKTPANNGSIFNFGAQSSAAANNSQLPSAPSASFGANSNPTPAFSFGASQPQSNETESNIDFQFGKSTPSTSTTPFTFGQDSAGGSSFTFTAGGNGPAASNPFTSSTAPSSAPKFGGNSAMLTPPSSFNFSFGQQAPCTPNTVSASQGSTIFGGSFNGTSAPPSFNFTQATPPQNGLNGAASKPTQSTSGVFSFLQAGNDASTGANSPFPPPSSMGTTPVNGTPEPQSQNEDGEETAQEQISLTNGGPGEEDETILHEVRAKAIKYVPVSKDSDDDQEGKSKSPWSTQGVGPLRVLKNKATGIIRVLLRAEPRGHIAMNKTILSDIDYRAKDKTLNFVAASDDGSCLETWVLQVKKPEFAQQLAAVLEANKSANKK